MKEKDTIGPRLFLTYFYLPVHAWHSFLKTKDRKGSARRGGGTKIRSSCLVFKRQTNHNLQDLLSLFEKDHQPLAGAFSMKGVPVR